SDGGVAESYHPHPRHRALLLRLGDGRRLANGRCGSGAGARVRLAVLLFQFTPARNLRDRDPGGLARAEARTTRLDPGPVKNFYFLRDMRPPQRKAGVRIAAALERAPAGLARAYVPEFELGAEEPSQRRRVGIAIALRLRF